MLIIELKHWDNWPTVMKIPTGTSPLSSAKIEGKKPLNVLSHGARSLTLFVTD